MDRMTIVEFLEARIAEDEQIATAASHPGWPWPSGEDLGEWIVSDRGHLYAGGSVRTHYGVMDDGDETSEELVRHMAQQDPARALREVAAKRAIIAASKDTYAGPPWEDADIESGAADVWDGRQTSYREVLANLASAYSDHPDYRKEWAIT